MAIHINHRSDIVERYKWSDKAAQCSMVFEYYSSSDPDTVVRLEWTGKDTNSIRYDKDKNTYFIYLDGHGLEPGRLMVRRHFLLLNVSFEDGLNDVFSTDNTGVILDDGPIVGDNSFDSVTNIDLIANVATRPAAPYVTGTNYSKPTIGLSYQTLGYDKTTVSPSMTYNQTITDIYSDGTSNERVIGSGATVTYAITSTIGATIDATSGKVTTTANTSSSQRAVGTVTVTVTLNGKSAQKTFEVKQGGVPEVCYYGFSTANPPASVSTAQSKTVSDGMTISITTDTTDKAKSQYVAFKAGSAYRVKSIVDSGNDGVDISTATIGGYTVYYMKADRGYVVDTNKFTIGK